MSAVVRSPQSSQRSPVKASRKRKPDCQLTVIPKSLTTNKLRHDIMDWLSTSREVARPDKIAQGPMISNVNIALEDFPWCTATATTAALGVDHTHAHSHVPTKDGQGASQLFWNSHHQVQPLFIIVGLPFYPRGCSYIEASRTTSWLPGLIQDKLPCSQGCMAEALHESQALHQCIALPCGRVALATPSNVDHSHGHTP